MHLRLQIAPLHNPGLPLNTSNIDNRGSPFLMPVNPCNISIKEARLPHQGLAEENPDSATKQNRASGVLKDYNADNQDDADHWSGLG
jgi:hypothetical protein